VQLLTTKDTKVSQSSQKNLCVLCEKLCDLCGLIKIAHGVNSYIACKKCFKKKEKKKYYNNKENKMRIQEQIKKDLTTAIKEKNEEKKSTLRVVMGEFGRLDKKELPDDDVIKVLKKLIKSEKEVIEKKGEKEDSEFIRIIETYLPKAVTEEEITAWIKQNIDFSKLKNKMQAMGQIMKHFGSAADGNIVKEILQKL